MKKKQSSTKNTEWGKPHDTIDKKFKDLKRRTEIKERYGVFTQKMFEQLLEELRTRIRDDLHTELLKLDEKLDWLIGKYKDLDEEHTLMSGQLSDHSDRLEVIEQKVGISP